MKVVIKHGEDLDTQGNVVGRCEVGAAPAVIEVLRGMRVETDAGDGSRLDDVQVSIIDGEAYLEFLFWG